MPATIGATAIAWIARVLSGRLVADRGDRSDSGDYMRTSLKCDPLGANSPQRSFKLVIVLTKAAPALVIKWSGEYFLK